MDTSVTAFMEASVDVVSVEVASAEAFVEASVEFSPVEAFMGASVELLP